MQRNYCTTASLTRLDSWTLSILTFFCRSNALGSPLTSLPGQDGRPAWVRKWMEILKLYDEANSFRFKKLIYQVSNVKAMASSISDLAWRNALLVCLQFTTHYSGELLQVSFAALMPWCNLVIRALRSDREKNDVIWWTALFILHMEAWSIRFDLKKRWTIQLHCALTLCCQIQHVCHNDIVCFISFTCEISEGKKLFCSTVVQFTWCACLYPQ